MRRASIILLTSATLAVSVTAAAPAYAVERICAKWVHYILLGPDGNYTRGPLMCARWVYLTHPQPVNPFWQFTLGPRPTDPSPWITERDYKARFQSHALNPQPIPPGKKKKKPTRKTNLTYSFSFS